MTNVVVSRQRNIQISTNATAGIIQTSVPVTLQNVPTLISGQMSVENLTNVDSTNEQDGSTLVYHANTKTYVVEPLLISAVDGGTF